MTSLDVIELKAHLRAAEPPADRPWGMRDLLLADPAGVLWRIAQG